MKKALEVYRLDIFSPDESAILAAVRMQATKRKQKMRWLILEACREKYLPNADRPDYEGVRKQSNNNE